VKVVHLVEELARVKVVHLVEELARVKVVHLVEVRIQSANPSTALASHPRRVARAVQCLAGMATPRVLKEQGLVAFSGVKAWAAVILR
jgi:hypothetical protein